MPSDRTPEPAGYLGIEAGGTRTTARWEQGDDAREITVGAANLQLLSDPELLARLRQIADALPRPRALAIGMAGTRTPQDRDRLKRALEKTWPRIPHVVTHDLDLALAAAGLTRSGDHPAPPRVLVLSGTGSCCYSRDARGKVIRAGGWGHVLGDQGSGFQIALQALRGIVEAWDLDPKVEPLGQQVLAILNLNTIHDLVPWAAKAGKDEVAALAPIVLAAAGRDGVARRTAQAAARHLARSALGCAQRLAPRGRVEFILAGGVLLGSDAFARAVAKALRSGRRGCRVLRLSVPGVRGAVELARNAAPPGPTQTVKQAAAARRPESLALPRSTGLSPTEQRNLRSRHLDRMSLAEGVELMLSEEERVAGALRRESAALVRALKLIVAGLKRGGRLIYAGAGTSGRLGILDASECPPTFRSPPEQVQGIIAGGREAVFRAFEGAEDDADAGAQAVAARQIGRRDVLVGIAASGRTPFVWGALAEARRRKARTVLLCFNPHLEFRRGLRPDVVIAPDLGPEVLTGSTRLKAGTATKLVLNAFTTLSMVRLGKVVENLMVDLNPSNQKLRGRAVSIVRELTGTDEPVAERALEEAGWVVKQAVAALGKRRRP